LLLRAKYPGDIDRLLRGQGASGQQQPRLGGAQQQMRAVPRCQRTQDVKPKQTYLLSVFRHNQSFVNKTNNMTTYMSTYKHLSLTIFKFYLASKYRIMHMRFK